MLSRLQPLRPTRLLVLILLLGAFSTACSPQIGDDAAKAGSGEPEPTDSTRAAPSDSTLQGTIANRPFTVEDATLQDGILKVRQGEDFFADLEVTIFLFLDSGELPEGRSWQVAADDSDFGHPHVHVSFKDESASLPKTELLMNGYDLDLQFGQAEDLTIPGKLSLRVAGSPGADIQGSFVADLEGLVLRNGVADPRVDGIATLQWLADHWLEQQVADNIEIVNHHGTMFHHADPDGGPQIGWTEVEYRSAPEAEIEEARLRFVKGDDGGWAVDQRFDATSLRAGHPLVEPGANEPFLYFPFVAARELEDKYAGEPLYDADFQISYGADEGEVVVSYKVGSRDTEAMETIFRFVRDGNGGWKLAE